LRGERGIAVTDDTTSKMLVTGRLDTRRQPAQSSGSPLSALLLFVDCAVSSCGDTTYDSCIEQVVPRVTKGGTGEGQNRNNRYNRYDRHNRLPLRLWWSAKIEV